MKVAYIAVVFALALPARSQQATVTTEWVAQNLANAKVRIVEVSVDPGVFVYQKGHVPGAIGLKWHSDLCDPVKRDILSVEQFEQLCSRNGIAHDTTVVFYGDNDNWFAAWGLWTFYMYGHRDVKLMDGGRTKWELEQRPWDAIAPAYAPTKYKVQQVDLGARARLSDVRAIVEQKGPAVLVDVRSPEEFSGRVIAPPGVPELAIRAGHIPGAKNVPWQAAVKPDGTFKPIAELKKLYADAGIDGSRPVITYCRIGERASHSWFVLKFLLGYDARSYDGSWTEWGNTVGVPIENQSGTVWTGK